MILWDVSPPPSQSADFPSKVAIPCPQQIVSQFIGHCAVRSVRLNWVTLMLSLF